MSIFSGNWWKNGAADTEFNLPAELDLICTAHYIEALTMQSKASEICGLLGGKMPHVMTLVPGGTSFVPTEEKLDDLWSLCHELRDWVAATMLPDTKAIAPYYLPALEFGKGCGRYVAWGVFERPSFEMLIVICPVVLSMKTSTSPRLTRISSRNMLVTPGMLVILTSILARALPSRIH